MNPDSSSLRAMEREDARRGRFEALLRRVVDVYKRSVQAALVRLDDGEGQHEVSALGGVLQSGGYSVLQSSQALGPDVKAQNVEFDGISVDFGGAVVQGLALGRNIQSTESDGFRVVSVTGKVLQMVLDDSQTPKILAFVEKDAQGNIVSQIHFKEI
jgi:hypothetical protein